MGCEPFSVADGDVLPLRLRDTGADAYEAQLNQVALGCGLALGELIQDEADKKLLLTVHQDPTRSSALASPNGLAATALRPCSST